MEPIVDKPTEPEQSDFTCVDGECNKKFRKETMLQVRQSARGGVGLLDSVGAIHGLPVIFKCYLQNGCWGLCVILEMRNEELGRLRLRLGEYSGSGKSDPAPAASASNPCVSDNSARRGIQSRENVPPALGRMFQLLLRIPAGD